MHIFKACLSVQIIFPVLQKLEVEADDSYLDRPWADGQQLKRQFQGLNNIKWGPR